MPLNLKSVKCKSWCMHMGQDFSVSLFGTALWQNSHRITETNSAPNNDFILSITQLVLCQNIGITDFEQKMDVSEKKKGKTP